jgi:hypothetical protein
MKRWSKRFRRFRRSKRWQACWCWFCDGRARLCIYKVRRERILQREMVESQLDEVGA